jgi:opacity protein-like surface antigen
MRKSLAVAVVAFSLACLAAAPAALAGSHRIGAGANYWKTVNNIDSKDFTDIDEDGLSWLASYQYVPAGIFKFEVDLEYYPRLAGEPDAFWSPEAFILVGGTLYAGAGIGVYFDGDIFSDKPFYMLRAGLDFAILPFLSLDINANYRFNDWDTFSTKDLDTDTIRLGAAVRFSL